MGREDFACVTVFASFAVKIFFRNAVSVELPFVWQPHKAARPQPQTR
jgi:hypothetical protein